MPSSQSEWDAKHRLAAERAAAEPASIVRELLPLLPRGPALDLACGTGRHTLLLAERGQRVVGLDWSNVALDVLETQARAKRISIKRVGGFERNGRRAQGGIELLQTDLDQVELPEQSFDLVLCFQYLQRSLFPQMTRALRPGGVLLLKPTHARNWNLREVRETQSIFSKRANFARRFRRCARFSIASCAPGRELPAFSHRNQ